MVILTGSLLANALFTAKSTMQQMVTHHLTAALTRGGDEATNWAQRYVATNGATATWPTKAQTDSIRQICATQNQLSRSCPFTETTSYAVIGSTVAKNASGSAPTPDQATNLQQAINENRISVVVTATIGNHSGLTVGTRSRRLTMRIFDAAPFAVVTGSEDGDSNNGTVSAGQGDSGGYKDSFQQRNYEPISSAPSLYKDTRIRVTLSCLNSRENSNQTNALVDNHSPGDNNMPWGVRDKAFEAPCTPTYPFATQYQPPADASQANANMYTIDAYDAKKPWNNSNNPNERWGD